jgi:hypothetical protein
MKHNHKLIRGFAALLAVGLSGFVEAFNIVSVQYVYKKEDDGSTLDKECPCIEEDENGVIQQPCYGVVEESGEEVGKCFAYDLDETLALENLVIVQGVPTPDRCAPAYLNCLLYRMNQLVQKRNPNTRTLLVRARLESFEDSDAAQDTGIATVSGVELSRYLSVGCFVQADGIEDSRFEPIAAPDGQDWDPKVCVQRCIGPGGTGHQAYEKG